MRKLLLPPLICLAGGLTLLCCSSQAAGQAQSSGSPPEAPRAVAALLTLVGYSMNDTIVVFDRIRENLRLSRREALPDVVNRSINQILSRTVLTSGFTFVTVLSLYVFGGQVLRGFSFALVVGIIIGTYSSIAVAAPMLVAWQEWRAGREKNAALPPAKRSKV